MNVLFLGRFYPDNLRRELLKENSAPVGFANHNFEMSIINGLSRQEDVSIQVMTIPGVFSFPHNNKSFFTKHESYLYNNIQVCSVGFCNLPFIKEIWATISLIIEIIQYIRKTEGDIVNVIINTPDNRLLNAINIAKLFTRKRITQTIIIPDIPSMITAMDKQSPIKAFILKFLNSSSMRQTSNSDGLVILTEAMMDFVDKPVKHIVMEGIVDVNTMDVLANEISDKEIILYTGTLRKLFGVMNLVEAFRLIESPDVELWICGSGDSKDAIESVAKQDARIKFWGLVDSQTALKLQRQATILVNPRTSEGEYTKYSFPSKTMEYLLSGKSVIIHRLPGIPEEYYDYVYTPEEETVQAMARCIKNVLDMDPALRNQKALRGRDFVMTNKNSYVQVNRILSMIKDY